MNSLPENEEKKTADDAENADKAGDNLVSKLIHEELSRSIIGAAMDVLNALKPGLDKKL